MKLLSLRVLVCANGPAVCVRTRARMCCINQSSVDSKAVGTHKFVDSEI